MKVREYKDSTIDKSKPYLFLVPGPDSVEEILPNYRAFENFDNFHDD